MNQYDGSDEEGQLISANGDNEIDRSVYWKLINLIHYLCS